MPDLIWYFHSLFPLKKKANWERKFCLMYYKFTVTLSTVINKHLIDHIEYFVISSDVHRYGRWVRQGSNRWFNGLPSVLEFYSTNMAIICIVIKREYLILYIHVGPTAKFPSFLTCINLWTQSISIFFDSVIGATF